MYGYNQLALTSNVVPFNGIGRLHYTNTQAGADDYTLVNYTFFSGDGSSRDPEATIGYARDPRPLRSTRTWAATHLTRTRTSTTSSSPP